MSTENQKCRTKESKNGQLTDVTIEGLKYYVTKVMCFIRGTK